MWSPLSGQRLVPPLPPMSSQIVGTFFLPKRELYPTDNFLSLSSSLTFGSLPRGWIFTVVATLWLLCVCSTPPHLPSANAATSKKAQYARALLCFGCFLGWGAAAAVQSFDAKITNIFGQPDLARWTLREMRMLTELLIEAVEKQTDSTV